MIIILLVFLIMIVVGGLYIWSNWHLIKSAVRGNCILWHHPDNNPNGIPALELAKVDNPPGPTYPVQVKFFLPEKLMHWCYEVKVKDKWQLVPFKPDDNIDLDWQTTGQLADALDWRPAKRILRPRARLLETAAKGGIIILGCASLFGIMMLLDMLNKPV